MKEQFVTYEIALALKELGFNEPCFAMFNAEGEIKLVLDWKHCSSQEKCEYIFGIGFIQAPLWQQAIDWIWVNHKIFVSSYLVPDKTNTIMWVTKFKVEDYWSTKEQAILKAIELIKDKKI